VILLGLLLLAGCAGEPETGPGKVRWDADTCERCRMAVSDRNFAAQVRGGTAGRKARLTIFDDLGCAVLWLDEQTWRDDVRTEIWVAGAGDGAWLDARSAHYLPGYVTPMDFGLGAVPTPRDGALDFAAAAREMRRRAASHHQPGGESR
jgi:hypothetical protein